MNTNFRVFCVLLFFSSVTFVSAQYNVNQNVNQNVNNNSNMVVVQNQPVIEKKVYIERYRTVYRDRPQPKRIARKLSAPICLLGYLWVYPEDLGTYNSHAVDIVYHINSQGQYGRNDWRVPTPDELRLMENYADKCGLGSEIYLATDHRNGVLRLVSSGKSISQQQKDRRTQEYQEELDRQERLANEQRAKQEKRAKEEMAKNQAKAKQSELVSSGRAFMIGAVLWDSQNKGAKNSMDRGVFYSAKDAVVSGWRLPTESEFYSIIRQGRNDGNYLSVGNGLIIPVGTYAIKLNDGSLGYINLQNGFKGSGNATTFIRLVQDRIY